MHIPARGERFLFTPHLKRELRPGSAWRGPGRGALAAHRNGRNTPSVGRIFGGELQNIPAGCFARGPLLQEKRGRRVPVAHNQGADRSGSGESLARFLMLLLFVSPVGGIETTSGGPHIVLSNCKQAAKNPAPRAIPWSRIFIFSGDSIITLRP